ncbi:dTDP-4-dehydrorhamnose reductase [Neptunomonas phycophila]|uniref:dTDP-4-dehydrorhamnose reductase n=1 Tax=Neptunomonas phycophila TaxID=1572645 RepID=UPI0026E2CB52|nr:dTDP-4-dehydrorhamnose reductase [Neptunomonas phycophila]MDO6782500.1 dTDP-4-dehydrorhamnose reductase [Neptunomonas phycophila]
MRILVTGSTGQVGFELLRALSPLGQIIAPTRQELDLGDLAAVGTYLEEQAPDMIINAAAWTAVDAAEDQKDMAFCLNADLPRVLAHYTNKHDTWLIHYSSDYVYPGTGTTPWIETDSTGPLSVYGKSKLAGDSAIQEETSRYLIFRTSWVYSARGNNFMKTMLRLGAERESLNIVGDQVGAPTPARLIAQLTFMAVCKIHSKETVTSGVFHLAPKGQTNWHAFACAIFTLAKEHGHALAVDVEKVNAIETVDYPTPAARPLNSRMDVAAIEQLLAINMPDWESQLELTLKEYLN